MEYYTGKFDLVRQQTYANFTELNTKDIKIILPDTVKELGYQDIRLGYVEGNNQSYSFWKKNGFIDTGLRNHNDKYTVVILNKKINDK